MDNLHKVPKELTDSDQWILWKAVQRDGKTTKVPCRADGTPTPVNDPASWLSFADACTQAEENADRIAGIGYCFSDGDPFVGIDLDDCLPLTPQAKMILAQVATYAEISPSGTGIKLIGIGERPEGYKNRTKDVDFGQIEVYDRDRFFTITGQSYGMYEDVEAIYASLLWLHETFLRQDEQERGTVTPVAGASSLLEQAGGFEASDDELIFFLCQDDKYARLWNGDFSDYGERGESEADLALVEKIAWLAGPYPERIERIMNASALARPKWFEREDYRRMTIDKALAGKGPGDFYSGGHAKRLESEDYARGSEQAVMEGEEYEGEKLTAFPIPERGIIRDVVDLVGPLTESPDSTLALGTLIMLSAIAGWGRVAKWGESEEPCILYASIVGPSASGRKTTGLRTVEAIFREVFSDDELRLETGGHTSGRGLIEQAIGGVDIFYVKEPKVTADEYVEGEINPQWVAENEELNRWQQMRDEKLLNPPAVVLIWDEMAKLLSVEGDWQRDTRAELLRMYNGYHGGIRTSGKEGLKIPKGRVQMGFLGTMVTDDLRRGLNSAQANDGLMGRILFSPDGDGKPPLAFPPEPPSDYEIRKQHLARKLMRFRERCETRQTVFAGWTHEARKAREEWYVERKRGSGLELMLFDRVQATAAKIACLLALAEDSDEIVLSHVELAQQMADTSIAVSVSAVEAAVESQRDRYLDALEERITRDGPIPMSVLLRDSGMLGVKEPGEKMPERELRKLWVEKDPRLIIEDTRGGRRVRLV